MRLGFYCLGNGVTVANRKVQEHGDYKNVAWISPAGNIRYYVGNPLQYFTADEMERMRRMAEHEKAAYMAQWNKLDVWAKYGKILDMTYRVYDTEIMQDVRRLNAAGAVEKYTEWYIARN